MSGLFLKIGYDLLQNTFWNRMIRFYAVDGKVKRVYASGSSGLWIEKGRWVGNNNNVAITGLQTFAYQSPPTSEFPGNHQSHP